jgi:hypothetical protein
MRVLNQVTHGIVLSLAMYCIVFPVPTSLAVAAGIYIAWAVIGIMRRWDRRIRADEREHEKKRELLNNMDKEYRELLCRKVNREYAREDERVKTGQPSEITETAKQREREEFARVVELGTELRRNVKDDLAAYSYPPRPNEPRPES